MASTYQFSYSYVVRNPVVDSYLNSARVEKSFLDATVYPTHGEAQLLMDAAPAPATGHYEVARVRYYVEVRVVAEVTTSSEPDNPVFESILGSTFVAGSPKLSVARAQMADVVRAASPMSQAV